LFKLHSPHNYIVGGGVFAHSTILPVSLAWEAFGAKNGTGSLSEMRQRLAKYRRLAEDPRADYNVGCILLEQPFFLPERDWLPMPESWSRNIVRGKTYDTRDADGQKLWREIVAALPGLAAGSPVDPYGPAQAAERFGAPRLVLPRLGQGSFRVIVTDTYARRCVVTGERTLPVLQAAHIRPFATGGPHDPRNGLLLRSDLHTLLDRGYITVTPQLRLEVSRKIRDEFENGRDYYALHGRQLMPPQPPVHSPAREYLEWHATNVFRS
jgi:putative restriction endonuclease